MSTRDELLRRLARSGPSDPETRRIWDRLSLEDRERLRWAATNPAAAAHLHTSIERELVDVLAAERTDRRATDVLGPLLTALLVLSTVWGFGRAALTEIAGWTLVLGVAAGAVACVAGWRRAARRRAAARAVRATLRS